MFAKCRINVRIAGFTLAVLFTAVLLAGCGGVKDRSAEVTEMWSAFPGSADWDMTIRGVVAQSKSVGDHDADFTIYLTTFTSKKVPGFSHYQTIDVRNGDTMSFENRIDAFFNTATGASPFTGVQDIEGFMQWYVDNMPGKYFIRMRMESGGTGEPSWTLIAADKEPTSSTMIEGAGTEIPLAFDQATGEWSVR